MTTLTILDSQNNTKYQATVDLYPDLATREQFLSQIRFLITRNNCQNGGWKFTNDVAPTNVGLSSIQGYYFELLKELDGNIDFSNNQLDQPSIDLILNTLASSSMLVKYSNKTINLGGSANAAPSAASAAAISTLQSQGCTITHS